jgi:hypothetical protein
MLYKVDIIFPQSHYRHTFSPLRETLYAGIVKVFAEASELFTYGLSAGRRRLRPQSGVLGSASFKGPKGRKSESAKSGL